MGSQTKAIELQLIIVLYRLGSNGEGATVGKIAKLFGIGDEGTLQNITDRVFTAIIKLKDRYVFWPSQSERKELVSKYMHELPHCIGYVDATEIKLAEKPSVDYVSYFSRKHMYSIKVQAVCDPTLNIRHVVIGYPGSVHDSRIYKNCHLATKPCEFFSGLEWLTVDSAYTLTSTVITPFKSNSNEIGDASFSDAHNKFKVRIVHCFGLLKERFNSLKELKLNLKNDSSIKKINRWILVCVILHNILKKHQETDFPHESDDDNNEITNDIYENLGTSSSEGKAKRKLIIQLFHELTD